MTSERSRFAYISIIIVVMLAGLSTRQFASILPWWIVSYIADVLWAIMIYLIIGLIFIRLSSLRVALYAIIITVSVEISQLYHAPWIDAIRTNKIGGLVLGFGFLWSDIVCYVVGILIVLMLEKILKCKELNKYIL
ncbi:DUF2809 domain-containing protein [Wukongibacter baidiensis]|uniref:ribosomal maturation YjgA family protein n=1 Tax=Wukongibacter baidiensis TaxID=1723361 RepID=UPI003D7F8C83